MARHVTGIALLVFSLPVLIALLRRPVKIEKDGSSFKVSDRRQWSRNQILRDPVFYALFPGIIIIQPFITSAVFFNQENIVNLKGWSLKSFVSYFPLLAGMDIISALATGRLIDRFNTYKLLPFFLLPLGFSVFVLAYGSSVYTMPIFLASLGITTGSASVIQGAIWAELYGPRYLGEIHSLVMTGVVIASASSPGLVGMLLDFGISLQAQLLTMGVFCFTLALWMGLLLPWLLQAAKKKK